MSFSVAGLISVVCFYVLILVVGIWAGRKSKGQAGHGESEDVMLAGRDIGLLVGVFTMTGGLLFAEKMRSAGYVTMLDPFQIKYGERMGGLLFIPALMGEVFWSAAILAALGATLAVILSIPDTASVIVSACIAVFYTFFGGLYSVAYTDVVQLGCIFVGLWICIPSSIISVKTQFGDNTHRWMGVESLPTPGDWLIWVDNALLLTFGGIPWQVYFQRVLSSKSAKKAKLLSYVAAFGCLIMAIPPILIGAVARKTAWNETDCAYEYHNGTTDIVADHRKLILPLVLRYLTPTFVAFVGLGAVSAAVMSSADSSILSAAAMFARNIWKLAIRPGASEKEVIIVLKVAILVVGVAATVMALLITSIYELWFLCADLVYVVLFPQLLCVVYLAKSNTYGALAGYIVGITLRVFSGEKAFNIPAVIKYWGFNEVEYAQKFPFRTAAMLTSLIVLVTVSYLTDWLFRSGRLQTRLDIFQCVVNIPPDTRQILKAENSSLGASSMSLANMNKLDNEGGGNTNPMYLHPNAAGRSGATTPNPDTPVSDISDKMHMSEKIPLHEHSQVDYETILKD